MAKKLTKKKIKNTKKRSLKNQIGGTPDFTFRRQLLKNLYVVSNRLKTKTTY